MTRRRLLLAAAILCAAYAATSYALRNVQVLPRDFSLRDLGLAP